MDGITEIKDAVKKSVGDFLGREWTCTEKVLLLVDCVLFGIVLGALWSPKKHKTTTIASNNIGTYYEEDDEDFMADDVE